MLKVRFKLLKEKQVDIDLECREVLMGRLLVILRIKIKKSKKTNSGNLKLKPKVPFLFHQCLCFTTQRVDKKIKKRLKFGKKKDVLKKHEITIKNILK